MSRKERLYAVTMNDYDTGRQVEVKAYGRSPGHAGELVRDQVRRTMGITFCAIADIAPVLTSPTWRDHPDYHGGAA